VQLPSSFIIVEAGRQVVLTNLDTGKEVTLNVTGTWQTMQLEVEWPYLTKWTFTGTNIFGSEDTGLVVLEGRFTNYTVQDADGNLVFLQPWTGQGEITDVCELLS
jgi:hypothetical protein